MFDSDSVESGMMRTGSEPNELGPSVPGFVKRIILIIMTALESNTMNMNGTKNSVIAPATADGEASPLVKYVVS